MNVNDRIKAKLQSIRASKPAQQNSLEATEKFVMTEVANRVSAALSVAADDAKLVAAVSAVKYSDLTAAHPEQALQIRAGVSQVIAAFEQLDEENNPSEEDLAVQAFTAALHSVLANLLQGEDAREEQAVADAIDACAEHIRAAFAASDDLEDQLADAVPVVLNALDVEMEDDTSDFDDEELEAICATLTDFVNANTNNPKRLTALARNLNAVGNLSLAAVNEKY